MGTLHLIGSAKALAQALELASAEDGLLLIGHAAARCGGDASRPVFVLADDIPAGVTPGANVTIVDYAGFVDLTCRHQPIVTWR